MSLLPSLTASFTPSPTRTPSTGSSRSMTPTVSGSRVSATPSRSATSSESITESSSPTSSESASPQASSTPTTGYTWSATRSLTASRSKSPVACVPAMPCPPSATCVIVASRPTCQCPPGYTFVDPSCVPTSTPATITDLVPPTVGLTGGRLQIFGVNFQRTDTVWLSGANRNVTCSNFTFVSSSEVNCIVPAWSVEGYVHVWTSNLYYGASNQWPLYYAQLCSREGAGYMYGCATSPCRTCPTGAFCPGGCRVWPLPGYQTSSELSGVVFQCHPDRCLGCAIDAYGDSSCANNGQPPNLCGTGYTGAGCDTCQPGYIAENQYCVPCTASTTASFVIFQSVLLAVFVLVCYFGSNLFISRFMFVLIMLQMVRTAGGRVPTSMPFLYQLSRLMSATSFDASSALANCDATSEAQTQFYGQFYGNIEIWGIVIGGILVGVPVTAWFRGQYLSHISFLALPMEAIYGIRTDLRMNWKTFSRRRVVRSLIVFLYAFYGIATQAALACIFCRRDPLHDQALVLSANAAIVCYQGRHAVATVVATFVLAGITVVFPVVSFVYVRRFKNAAKLGRDSEFAFYYDQCKPTSPYYLPSYLGFVLVQAFIAVCMRDFLEVPGLAMGLGTAAGVLFYVAVRQPYVSLVRNVFSALSISGTMLVMVLNYLSSQAPGAFLIVTVVFVAVWGVVFTALLVWFLRRWWIIKKTPPEAPMVLPPDWFTITTVNPTFYELPHPADQHWEDGTAFTNEINLSLSDTELAATAQDLVADLRRSSSCDLPRFKSDDETPAPAAAGVQEKREKMPKRPRRRRTIQPLRRAATQAVFVEKLLELQARGVAFAIVNNEPERTDADRLRAHANLQDTAAGCLDQPALQRDGRSRSHSHTFASRPRVSFGDATDVFDASC